MGWHAYLNMHHKHGNSFSLDNLGLGIEYISDATVIPWKPFAEVAQVMYRFSRFN